MTNALGVDNAGPLAVHAIFGSGRSRPGARLSARGREG